MSIAYYIYHVSPGPLGFILNLLIWCIVALIVFLIFQWIALEFGVPAKIVKLVGLLIFLICVLSMFVGCGTPVTLSGGYEDAAGVKYSAGATFTLPNKKGYAK